ncbi:MAG: hypothetical protein AB7H79_10185 [Sphingomonas sp.]
MLHFLFVVASSLLAASAAQARDAAELACPIAGLSADDQAAFTAAVMAGAPENDPRLTPFWRGLFACREQYAWSEEVTTTARRYAVAVAGVTEIRRDAEARGIDVQPFEQAILVDEALLAAGADRYPQAEIEALLGRLTTRINAIAEVNPRADVVRIVGDFIAFRAIAETMRRRFIAT